MRRKPDDEPSEGSTKRNDQLATYYQQGPWQTRNAGTFCMYCLAGCDRQRILWNEEGFPNLKL